MLKRKHRRIELSIRDPVEKEPVPIVADAVLLIKDFADSKALPVLVLDTTERPDIETMVEAHETSGTGECLTAWDFSRTKRGIARLVIRFDSPSKCVMVIDFGLLDRGGVVDQIIRTNGFYLVCGKPGDRFMGKHEEGRVLVEVTADPGFDQWTTILTDALARNARRESGVPRKQAKGYARAVIKDWRELWDHPVGDHEAE